MKPFPPLWHELVISQEASLLERSVVRVPAAWINAWFRRRGIPADVKCLADRAVLRFSYSREESLVWRFIEFLGRRRRIGRTLFTVLPRHVDFELSCRYLAHTPDGTLTLEVLQFTPRLFARLVGWALPGVRWDIVGSRLVLSLPKLPRAGRALDGPAARITYAAVERLEHTQGALLLRLAAGRGLAAFLAAYGRGPARAPQPRALPEAVAGNQESSPSSSGSSKA